MVKRTDRKTEPNRAAIYARVSDKSQDAEDKTSISEQISDMQAPCARSGLTIVARYQELSVVSLRRVLGEEVVGYADQQQGYAGNHHRYPPSNGLAYAEHKDARQH